MDNKVQEFIEKNVQLIDDGDFGKLIRKCPTDIRPGLFQALAEAGIEFPDIEDGTLYGLQTVPDIKQWFGATFRDTHKLCISSFDKKNNAYRFSYVKSNGVKGGYQIAFPSLKKAMNFANKVRNEISLAPYKISNQMNYTWSPVTLTNGEIVLATDKCIKELDPYDREQKRLKQKANKEIEETLRPWIESLNDKIDINKLNALNTNSNSNVRNSFYLYWDKGSVTDYLGSSIVMDEKDLLNYLNSILDVDNITVKNNWIIIEDSYIDQVEKDIYNKYGVKI